MAKIPDKNAKKKQFVVDISNIEVLWIYNTTNNLPKYNQHLNAINNKAAIDLEL